MFSQPQDCLIFHSLAGHRPESSNSDSKLMAITLCIWEQKKSCEVTDFFPVYIYFGLVVFITFVVLGLSALFPARTITANKYLPYESGIKTDTNLQNERFVIRHYLIALLFLVFDIEVIFLYPWAVIAKNLGPFAFYEMLFFLVALLVGFAYVWRKGALQWEE